MPRDASGAFYFTPGTAAVANQTAHSGHINQRNEDIAADLNAPRPVSAGGTGVSTMSALLSLIWQQQIELGANSTVAAPSYVDFHSDGNPASDYNARIVRQSGANGNLDFIQTGTGNINLVGGTHLLRNGAALWHESNSPTMTWNIVGSLVFAYNNTGVVIGPSEIAAGSGLVAAGTAGGSLNTSAALSGTWRCLGYAPPGFATLFARIA